MTDQLLTRLKPFDIVAFKTAQGNDGSMTLNQAITAMQGALSYACPQCFVDGSNTGVITVTPPGLTVVCPTCGGMLKTDVPYLANPAKPGTFIGLGITGVTFITPEATMQLSATVPGGVWSSGTPGHATIDSVTGLVTGVAAGTSAISYTVSGKTVSVVITVSGVPA